MLAFPELKNSTCILKYLPEQPKVERYVVENKADLKRFLNKFTNLKALKSIVRTLEDNLEEGQVLLLTDNSYAGFPTYCFEHEGSIERVK